MGECGHGVHITTSRRPTSVVLRLSQQFFETNGTALGRRLGNPMFPIPVSRPRSQPKYCNMVFGTDVKAEGIRRHHRVLPPVVAFVNRGPIRDAFHGLSARTRRLSCPFLDDFCFVSDLSLDLSRPSDNPPGRRCRQDWRWHMIGKYAR